MIKCKSLQKFKDKQGRIIGYRLIDTQGKTIDVKSADLKRAIINKQVDVVNLVLTSDNRLIEKENKPSENKPANAENARKKITDVRNFLAEKAAEQEAKRLAEQKAETASSGNTTTEKDNDGFLNKVKPIIAELKQYKSYEGSYESKIVASVEKRESCSEKQFNKLNETLNTWKKCNMPKVGEDREIVEIPETEEFKQAKILIDKLNRYGDPKDFWNNIAKTVLKTKRCSEKQYVYLEKAVNKLKVPDVIEEQAKVAEVKEPDAEELITENNETEPKQDSTPIEPETVETEPVETEPEPVETEPEPVETEPEPVEPEIIVNTNELLAKDSARIKIPELSIVTPGGAFKYTIMKGEVYIVGFVEGKETDTIVIPDTVSLNGEVRKICGIGIRAFKSEQGLVSVKTGKYIKDIGIEAFANCRNLEFIDLSQSAHNMIPANMCLDCKSLKSANIGLCVERIHEYAFAGCSKLNTVVLSDTTSTIARCAFFDCRSLQNINCTAKVVNEKAFARCYMLNNFDFSHINVIGTQAFVGTGFTSLTIPGTIREIGRQAFADCALLKEVTVCEGVEVIKEFCFGKSKRSCSEYSRFYEHKGFNEPFTELEVVDTPKSVKDVGNDAFRHAKLVKVFTGSACESVCISFGVPFERKDAIDEQNSTMMRRLAPSIGANIMEVIENQLNADSEGASNPANMAINTDKFVKAGLNELIIKVLKLETPCNEPIEPHAKFKGAINYITDICQPFTLPLTANVLRLQGAMFIETNVIYNDGYNFIYRITFYIKDTLESGSFLLFTMGNEIVYVADINTATELVINEVYETNKMLPVDNVLHAGDKIGHISSIGGAEGRWEDKNGIRHDTAKSYFNRLKDNSIQIDTTRTNSVMFIPAVNKALQLFDSRKDVKESYLASRKGFTYYTVTNILDYEAFINLMKPIASKDSDSVKFFRAISKMSKSEVEEKLASISIVGTENVDNLYMTSLNFVNSMKLKNKEFKTIKPDDLTYNQLIGLSKSYWMIPKDVAWYNSIAHKSLNKINEYKIENKYTLNEYKSNQIVKFSNPYMTGQKGAYIFVLNYGNTILGVYASKHTLQEITEMLYELTYIPDAITEDEKIKLITKADELDQVNPNLFFKFYDVLYAKGDWNIGDIISMRIPMRVGLAISMYKPTGVFYLVMYRYTVREDYENGKKVYIGTGKKAIPILPIGNMDRALMVAETTNKNNRTSKFKDEMLALSIWELMKERNLRYYVTGELKKVDPINYYKARQLAIDGETSTDKYLELIDARAVYMLGTVGNRGVSSSYEEDIVEEEDDDWMDEYDDYEEDEDWMEEFDDEDIET